MRVISAATESYAHMARGLQSACRALGMPLHIYGINTDKVGDERFDLDDELQQRVGRSREEREIQDVISKSPYKPELLLRAAYEFREPLIWLDADAFPITRLSPFDGRFDIGVTMRRASELSETNYPWYSGYLNAGVVFVDHTPRARGFLIAWSREIPNGRTQTDQEALTTLTLGNDRLRWTIHRFTTDEYNFYYREPRGPLTKVIHVKAGDKADGGYERQFRQHWPGLADEVFRR